MSDLDLATLNDAARRAGGLSRRTFLAYSAVLSSLPGLAERVQGAVMRQVAFAADPFTPRRRLGRPDQHGRRPLDPARAPAARARRRDAARADRGAAGRSPTTRR